MKRAMAACAALLMSMPAASAMGDAPMNHKQALTPPHAVEMYLDGFHNYAGQSKLSPEKQLQLRVSHYCKQVSPKLFQCIVYLGNSKDARLLGVEYVVTEDVYKSFSAEEKKLWHPHDEEVDSGMLTMPGMEPEAEKKTLQFLRSTWGKTWHAWQPNDEIPLGKPTLMWAVPKNAMNTKTKSEMESRKKDPCH